MILDRQRQREILFRGKSNLLDTWIFGNLIYNRFQTISISDKNGYLYPIYPQTSGQYTGIDACNGRRIFEHDIVHCRIYPYLMRTDLEKSLNGIPKEVTGQVVMHKGTWVVKNSRGMCFQLGDVYSAKVLGNVFDDFELLEEQT